MPKDLNNQQERKLGETFRKRFEEAMTLDEDQLREALLEAVQDQLTPDEVFDEEDLITWAEENGFTRKEVSK
jgi:hypothetical protein